MYESPYRRELDRFTSPYRDPSYPKGEYSDASRYWAERLQIPALSESYERALGDRHAEFQKELGHLGGNTPSIPDRALPFLYRLHDELCTHYPEIEEIACEKPIDVWHVVYGCLSKYAAEDISYFVSVTSKDRSDEEDLRLLRIQKKLGFHLAWRLGPESMRLIEDRLGLEPWMSGCRKEPIAGPVMGMR